MSLEHRIEQLERSNRRWRLGVFGGAVLALGAWGMSCGQAEVAGQTEAEEDDGPSEIVRTRRLEVVNEAGAVVVAIAPIGEAGGVSTFDGHDQEIVRIGASDGLGGVELRHQGEVLARIGVTPEGQGAVSIFGGATELAAMGPLEGGCGGITYRDPSGDDTRHLGGCVRQPDPAAEADRAAAMAPIF